MTKNLEKAKPQINSAIITKWQRIVDLMAQTVEVPIGLIMKVDSPQIEVFTSSKTEGNPYVKGDRADLNTGLYCEEVIKTRAPLLVPDALKDPKWDHNPDIDLGLVYYYGFPLEWPDGDIFGTICILDYKENPLASKFKDLIEQFKDTIKTDLRLVVHSVELEKRVKERTKDLQEANHLLKKEIAEHERTEKTLKVALSERDVLLKEIHHRVKNNMQIISSLLRLQSRFIKDEQYLEIFKVAQNRIRAMGFIHEILYNSKNLAQIDFSDYVRKIETHLRQIYAIDANVIKFNNFVEEIYLGIDTAIPCGLIINELVSNSMRHAFPSGQKGEICVEFRSLAKEFELIVADNGIGLPNEMDFCDTDSLGMQLVVSLTNQLDGHIELDRTNGTKHKIIFSEN